MLLGRGRGGEEEEETHATHTKTDKNGQCVFFREADTPTTERKYEKRHIASHGHTRQSQSPTHEPTTT